MPFYLRTGKALAARDTEIVIQFKDVPLHLFPGAEPDDVPANKLILQIQPNEGMRFEFVAKTPGPKVETTPVAMDFRYADRFQIGGRTGYETLLYDVLTGDPMLFSRADQIEGGWRVVQPLLDAWSKTGAAAPDPYPAGSDGPKSADELLARDGRAWHEIS